MNLAEIADSMLADAAASLADPVAVARVQELRRRLTEPLRVAIAGRVKSGKSTLLNALLGERLAPTGVRECTRVVTWYEHGDGYSLTVDGTDGSSTALPFRRDGDELDTDLGGRALESVERLVVRVPTRALRTMTFIDSPGIDAIDHRAELATREFLVPGEHRERQADAVLYLMRHVHRDDVSFLDAFHDDANASASPINAIGVLSRADEIGAGRPDAMASAGRIAERLRHDHTIRRLCQTVVPVVGLLAQAADGLTERHMAAFRAIAASGETARLLASVDDFRVPATGTGLAPEERDELLTQFGLYGVRVVLDRLVQSPGTTTTEMVKHLRSLSGIDQLVTTLQHEFTDRAALLRARSALIGLEAVLEPLDDAQAARLRNELQETWATNSELTELRLLLDLRAGHADLDDAAARRAEALLAGGPLSRRLGLGEGATHAQLMASASEARDGWHRRAEHPGSTVTAAAASRVLVHLLEREMVQLMNQPT